MQKPSYYLRRSDFSTQDEYENTKKHFTQMGFRVVTFMQSQSNHDIQEGIKALIQNHISDKESDYGKDVSS